mmetsp:Transcript_31004/g.76305  ORF Transcript_31004/g.76305 Transcript_31004/m.76305 type:complete len:105 (-) Transcript_31004:156-470(-)
MHAVAHSVTNHACITSYTATDRPAPHPAPRPPTTDRPENIRSAFSLAFASGGLDAHLQSASDHQASRDRQVPTPPVAGDGVHLSGQRVQVGWLALGCVVAEQLA